MRPVSCFSVPRCFSVDPVGGRRQRSQYRSRQSYQPRPEASRSWKPPSAAPRPAAAPSSRGDNGLSSGTSEDQNAMQQPKEVFPRENRDGSSDFPTFRSGNVFKKRSRDSSTVKLEVKLEESEDECDLVIDIPPEPVNKKMRTSRKYTNVMRDTELAPAMRAEKSHGSATGGGLGDGEEESERLVILRKNDRVLNKYEKLRNASPKAYESHLSDVKTATLQALEERDAHASTAGKCASSAALIEADTQKGILKRGNAKPNRLVKAFAQEHAKEHHVKSGKQSAWCTGQSSKDETTSELPCKKTINTEEGQSIEENGGGDGSKESYTCPTYLNYKESKTILQSSSVKELESFEEDSELSDSDDPVEECRRIFDEFERETQKKNSEMQAYRQNADLNALETKANIPGQKRRIAHAVKCHDHDAAIQQGQRKATEFPCGVRRGKDLIATTSEQKKDASRLPAVQFQSLGPVVSLNLVQTSNGQLHIQLAGNVATALPGVRSASLVPCKISVQKRPSIPESGFKVPLETRQRYVSLFLAECFKICATVNEAINQALIEEQGIYDRCGNKKMYLNFAVKTLKKLRDHGQLSNIGSCSEAASITPGEDKAFTGGALYELLKYYLLTEEQLNEHNFPRPNPEKNGGALFARSTKKACYDAFKRVCCRCGKIYTVTSSGEHRRQEECNYHSVRVLEKKVPGGMDKWYSCCEGIVGSPGCQNAKLHVHDGRKEKLEGFMKTFIKPPPFDGNYGVYALDCEMCYTTHGLELTRVTVVDAELRVVYDTFVKPHGKVVDYDTRLSGVTEDDLKNTTTSILDVQAVLLNLFNVNTILIGHSLEKDLFVLKLIHEMVVDTSVVFPHRLGFPHKRALRSLMADYLRKIHQDDVDGCNSREDAIACMELMLWKIKEDNKRKK